ncbi:MAG: hypothetical protein COC01_07775 [Bacteroidetes bacterium]|nr:MAG: hypothetical protein COC01_07775 [Bacteroidota bacterium]
MLRKSCLYLLLLLFSISESYGQDNYKDLSAQQRIDSLQSAYQTATHDTTKINALNSWGEEIYLTNPDSALVLCKKAASLAEKNLSENLVEGVLLNVQRVFEEGLSDAYTNIAFMYENQSEFDEALKYYFLSLTIYEKIQNKEWVSIILYQIASIYEDQGKIQRALEYFYKALIIQEEIGLKQSISYSLSNIGKIIMNQGELDKALEYYLRALKIQEEIKDTIGISTSVNNIGTVYDHKGELDKALEYFLKALRIVEIYRDSIGIAYANNNTGRIYEDMGKIDKAYGHYLKALKITEDIGDEHGISWCERLLGYIFLGKDNLQTAEGHGLKSLEIAYQLGDPDMIRGASSLLSKIYRKQNKWRAALEMYELKIQMRDSLLNEENTKATIRHQMKYDYEKEQLIKEQEEKEQARLLEEKESRRNRLHYSAIFIGILVLFGGVMALGYIKVSPRTAEAIIFISFLILFEFILIVADPYIEKWTGGAPVYQLIFNALIACCIFPLHSFFETKLKRRLVKTERKKWSKGIKELMIIGMVLSHTSIYAQTSKVDSLKSAYEVAEHDTTRAKLLLELSEHIYLSNSDTIIPLCLKAIEVIDRALPDASPLEEISFLHTKAGALNNIGFINEQHGEIEKALNYISESLKIFEDFFSEESQKKWSQNLDEKTILKSVKIFKKGLANSLNNIGFIHENQGEVGLGLEYYQKALKIQEEIGDKYGISASLNNIGFIHENQGEVGLGLEYYQKALKIKEEIGDKYGIAYSLNNIGLIYHNQGEVALGLEYYYKSLKIREEIGDKYGIAMSLNNIGSLELEQGNVEEAKKLLERALELERDIGSPALISSSSTHLSKVAKKQGSYKEALEMYELHVVMRDSINNEETQKAAIKKQMQYEYEKEQIIKEQQEKELARIESENTSRRNNLHYSAIFIGILILFGGVLMLGFIRIRP